MPLASSIAASHWAYREIVVDVVVDVVLVEVVVPSEVVVVPEPDSPPQAASDK